MRCDIGNAAAIEGYRPDPDDPKVVYRPLPGEQTTTFVFPEGMDVGDAVSAVLVTMGAHMQPDAIPSWVESDDSTLKTYLCALWNLSPTSERPASWGSPKENSDGRVKLATGKSKTKKAGAPAPMPKTEEN